MTYLSGPLPRIIAHRGLAIAAPENTLLAFVRALSSGATHVETDVRASADGVAVLSHDPDLSRLADRPDLVGDLTMSKLHRIALGHGQSFCSLAEALDAFPDARFNIDIKELAAAAPTVKAVKAARATHRVLITSFDEKRRRAAVDALPGVASSASVSRFLPAILAAKVGSAALAQRALAGLVAVQIPERSILRLVTARTIHVLHAAGVEVHVWTVNDAVQMERLLTLGVDGLITDRCDTLVKVLNSQG